MCGIMSAWIISHRRCQQRRGGMEGIMAQATLTRVLKDIKTLEPEELRQVQHALESQLAPTTAENAEEGFLQAMLDAGLITEIKRPDRSRKRERRPVPIQGKPLSETIIEERR